MKRIKHRRRNYSSFHSSLLQLINSRPRGFCDHMPVSPPRAIISTGYRRTCFQVRNSYHEHDRSHDQVLPICLRISRVVAETLRPACRPRAERVCSLGAPRGRRTGRGDLFRPDLVPRSVLPKTGGHLFNQAIYLTIVWSNSAIPPV